VESVVSKFSFLRSRQTANQAVPIVNQLPTHSSSGNSAKMLPIPPLSIPNGRHTHLNWSTNSMSCKVGRPILIKKKANVVGWEIKGKELVFRCAPSIARPVREQVISSPIFSGINIPIVSVDVTTSGT
jgi:hypothetical protein